jgi:hypothetical protein
VQTLVANETKVIAFELVNTAGAASTSLSAESQLTAGFTILHKGNRYELALESSVQRTPRPAQESTLLFLPNLQLSR